ncbi:hypothetical protein Tco_1104524 [Tanacetum coccineum]
MRTRSQSRRHRQQQVPQTSVESPNLEKPNNNQESPVVTMADNRTMAELLQAPTEGYEDAIVVPAITADNFELKHSLLTLVQNKQFFGHDKEDPHAHIRYFNKITSTFFMWPRYCWINSFIRLPQFLLLPPVLMKLQNKCLIDHASEGMTASVPYARLNGVSLLLVLGVV